jgi:1-aminocyclopropane-1-carboxylate deaminase
MMFGIHQLVNENYFQPGSNIVAIHTGGLQGVMGYYEKGFKFNWMS